MYALIAAEPGKPREGLYSLLSTCPEIEDVSFIDDLDTIHRWVRTNPASIIVIYPSFLFNKVIGTIQSIKRQDPASIVIAIATNQAEASSFRNVGDGVLIRGFSSNQLYQLIGRLVDRKAKRNPLIGAIQ